MSRVKTMTQLIEILIRLKKGESIRNICKETGTHREVIRKIKDIGDKQGWLSASCALPTEKDMDQAYNEPENCTKKSHILDRYSEKLKQYKEDGKSFVIIHKLISEYSDCADISETTVRRYIQKKFPEIKPVMIRPLEDGVMEVDFGHLGLVYNPLECCNKKAWVFSGRLRKSRKAYREIVYNQKKETFFLCHIHAFHHFGGIPRKVVPDNLKSAVVKAAFYDPVINRSYQELAKHYDFLISPCLPGKPEHKGGVESDIKYIKRNFWPYFAEKQKQKGHQIPLSIDIEESLKKWDEDTADIRIVHGTGRSPFEMFIEESKTLTKLPLDDWDMISWKSCVVRPEWMIQYDSSYYSVPYKYIGQEVMVCADSKSIKVYSDYELIAFHERAKRKWEYIHNPLHAPPYKEEYMAETSESMLTWARSIGQSILEVVGSIISHRQIDGFRSARALLFLTRKYPKERVEAACRRAIFYDTPNYTSVKTILVKELDLKEPFNADSSPKTYLPFRYARDNNYFKI
jgi:transposase